MKRILLGLGFLALATNPAAKGCAALAGSGPVGINTEAAVIIWDEAHHTEHFIRSAVINSTHGDVGFLVPTPTTPELALADKRIFDLARKYLPIYRGNGPVPAASAPPGETDGKEPVVVAEQDIGDYHAVTLDASDPVSLGNWLKKNDYLWTDSTAQWLGPYLKAK